MSWGTHTTVIKPEALAERVGSIALPIRKRKLVMKQPLRAEALAAFNEWECKADKVAY